MESNGAAVRARHLPLAPGLCAHGPPALDGQQHTDEFSVEESAYADDVGAIFRLLTSSYRAGPGHVEVGAPLPDPWLEPADG